MTREGWRRAASLASGLALLAVAVAFCVRTGLRERDRVADALAEATAGWLAAALGLAAAAMLVVATGWGRCLAALGRPRPPALVVRWFFLGEVGKYVPGAVWPVLGRAELARRGGVDRPSAYHSVALSLAVLYGAAVLPVAAVAAHPGMQRRLASAARRASRGRVDLEVVPWPAMIRLLAGYLSAWALIAGVTAAVVAGYGGSVGWQAPAAAVLAWVCGFLAVPVPAGAGVREAVFVATSGLEPGLGLTVAVTSRLAFVVVDLAGAALSALATPAAHGPEGAPSSPG